MKVLWRDGKCTVAHVREALADGFRDLAHTSVMTTMAIMSEKGYLKRHRKGRSHIYEATLTEDGTRSGMLEDLVDRVFSGSKVAAMVNLLETGDIEADELAELRELIDAKGRQV